MALITMIVTAIAVSGILIIYLMQGTPMLARTRVPDKSGSLIAYIRQQQKNASAYDRLHELELHIPTGHKASDFTIEAKDEYKGYIIHIPGINASYFADYPVSGNGRNISDMTYNVTHKGGSINITTDQPFFIKKSSDGKRVFFDFTAPRDYFDKIVVIDAGHGGNDSGAIGPTGVMEKTVTLRIANEVRRLLMAEGATVYMTRDTDTEVSPKGANASDIEELQARCDVANQNASDVFVSIHMDSFSSGAAKGTTGYYYSLGSQKSRDLADKVRSGVIDQIGTQSRGTQSCNFYVVKHTDMPATLVEVAFISNPTEEQLLDSEDVIKKAAQGIVDGIADFFG